MITDQTVVGRIVDTLKELYPRIEDVFPVYEDAALTFLRLKGFGILKYAEDFGSEINVGYSHNPLRYDMVGTPIREEVFIPNHLFEAATRNSPELKNMVKFYADEILCRYLDAIEDRQDYRIESRNHIIDNFVKKLDAEIKEEDEKIHKMKTYRDWKNLC